MQRAAENGFLGHPIEKNLCELEYVRWGQLVQNPFASLLQFHILCFLFSQIKKFADHHTEKQSMQKILALDGPSVSQTPGREGSLSWGVSVYVPATVVPEDSNLAFFFEAYNALRCWLEWLFCSSLDNQSNYEITPVQCTGTSLFHLCPILPLLPPPPFWGRLYTSTVSHIWWNNFDFLEEFQNLTDYPINISKCH